MFGRACLMGCFLACFGFSRKRKQRKQSNRITSGDQRHGGYKPLTSKQYTSEDDPNSSEYEFSGKGKERSSLSLKKKVSFNLNVKAYDYEPLPNVDFKSYFSERREKYEESEEETAKAGNNPTSSRVRTYPSNYRYQNCSDSSYEYDEDDGINLELEESDVDSYDSKSDSGNEECNDNGGGGGKTSQQQFPEKLCDLSVGSQKRVTTDDNKNPMPLAATSLDQYLFKAARDRSQYVFSVLNPVENLNQWKAVKRKPTTLVKQQMKENMPSSSFAYKQKANQSKPLMQGHCGRWEASLTG